MLVVGMLLYSLAIAPVRASEPSYEGKPLSDWLLALEFHRAGHDNLVSDGYEAAGGSHPADGHQCDSNSPRYPRYQGK